MVREQQDRRCPFYRSLWHNVLPLQSGDHILRQSIDQPVATAYGKSVLAESADIFNESRSRGECTQHRIRYIRYQKRDLRRPSCRPSKSSTLYEGDPFPHAVDLGDRCTAANQKAVRLL